MKLLNGTESFQWPRPGRVAQRSTDFPIRLLAMAMAWALAAIPSLHGQQSKHGEYDVKAAYLYNFGRFVGWPARVSATDESFSICVLGQDPFGRTLDGTLVGETIGGKRVVAKRISKPQEALNCRILFISSSEEKQLNDTLVVLNKADVLTVSDLPEFMQRGGMIQFVLEGNKVRFEVNLAAAENAGLSLSSELLKVAKAVRRNSQSGD